MRVGAGSGQEAHETGPRRSSRLGLSALPIAGTPFSAVRWIVCFLSWVIFPISVSKRLALVALINTSVISVWATSSIPAVLLISGQLGLVRPEGREGGSRPAFPGSP